MTYPIFNFSNGIAWGDMLGNGAKGDCVEAAFENLRVLKAVSGLGPLGRALYQLGFRRPHTRYTLSLYYEWGLSIGEKGSAKDPNEPDQGTSMPSFGQWLINKGLALGFASVDVTSAIIDGQDFEQRMRDAALDFHGGMIEVNLPSTIWTQFYSKDPLSLDPGVTPTFVGGHAMAHVAGGPSTDGFVSWGRTKTADLDWVSACRFGYWVFLTKEDQSRKDYDFAGAVSKLKTMNDATLAPGL